MDFQRGSSPHLLVPLRTSREERLGARAVKRVQTETGKLLLWRDAEWSKIAILAGL
jgi:hypothetical protein